MAAIPFSFAQNTEIDTGAVQDCGRRSGNILHAIVKRRYTVHKIQGFGGLFFTKDFDGIVLPELFGPIGPLSILPQGLPRFSSDPIGFWSDWGTMPSSTMPRRKSTILSMYSIPSGHSCSQAPQVVQDQISSSS